MSEVDYKKLQGAAKELNDACGLTIKVIGGKKADLVEAINEAVTTGLDGVPQSVTDFHKKYLATSPGAAPEPAPVVAPQTTKLGNTFEALTSHAKVLNVTVVDGLSIEGLEKLLFETSDALSEEEWLALPEETKAWDSAMGEKVKELKKAKKKAKAAEGKGSEGKGSEGKDDEAKPKREAQDPRPDFKFTEGTNAHQIMVAFDALFDKAKGEGLKIKDIQDACEKAGIKSKSVRSRVSGVLKYARLPEGGEQVVKKGGLFYKKGHVPED